LGPINWPPGSSFHSLSVPWLSFISSFSNPVWVRNFSWIWYSLIVHGWYSLIVHFFSEHEDVYMMFLRKIRNSYGTEGIILPHCGFNTTTSDEKTENIEQLNVWPRIILSTPWTWPTSIDYQLTKISYNKHKKVIEGFERGDGCRTWSGE
jgi:hypothetical protein